VKNIISTTPAETEAVGVSLASLLSPGDVVALYGGLGAGKTAFVRGLATGLGITAEISSPTFALVHDYGTGIDGTSLVHFDMYRVTGWDDLDAAGFYDYLDRRVILAVEWAENIESALPAGVWRVTLTRLDDTRRRIEIELA